MCVWQSEEKRLRREKRVSRGRESSKVLPIDSTRSVEVPRYQVYCPTRSIRRDRGSYRFRVLSRISGHRKPSLFHQKRSESTQNRLYSMCNGSLTSGVPSKLRISNKIEVAGGCTFFFSKNPHFGYIEAHFVVVGVPPEVGENKKYFFRFYSLRRGSQIPSLLSDSEYSPRSRP